MCIWQLSKLSHVHGKMQHSKRRLMWAKCTLLHCKTELHAEMLAQMHNTESHSYCFHISKYVSHKDNILLILKNKWEIFMRWFKFNLGRTSRIKWATRKKSMLIESMITDTPHIPTLFHTAQSTMYPSPILGPHLLRLDSVQKLKMAVSSAVCCQTALRG